MKLDPVVSKNSVISEDGQTASRDSPSTSYHNSAVTLNRPIPVINGRAYFEVLINEPWMGTWSGSLKIKFFDQIGGISEDLLENGSDPTCGDAKILPGMLIGVLFDKKQNKMQYFRNGEPFDRPFDPRLPLHSDHLWPVVYLYARTVSVSLVQPPEWSTETHRDFPQEFKMIVKTLLLCHRRQDGNLVSNLPKFVLLDEIFPFLGDLYAVGRVPSH